MIGCYIISSLREIIVGDEASWKAVYITLYIINKHQRKFNGQSIMDNAETVATLETQEAERRWTTETQHRKLR